MQLRVSIGICTWNRAESLKRTLESLARVRVPASVSWEVLVVNNRCTDTTNSVVEDFASLLPVVLLQEDMPGKSHALNRASRVAQGQYIIWTDDDVLVDRAWLIAYVDAFRRWPESVVFGGPIKPVFEGQPPAWLREALPAVGNAYAALDLGPDPVVFDQQHVPYGANMAISTVVQRAHLYDTTLGPVGDSGRRGEETMLVRQLLADGYEGRWVPNARVEHSIPEDRQTTAYLRKYFASQGRVFLTRDMPDDIPRLFGVPRWLWRQRIEAEVHFLIARVLASPNVWVKHLELAASAEGAIRELRRRKV